MGDGTQTFEVQQGMEGMTVVRAMCDDAPCCWRLESPKEARAFIDDVIGLEDIHITGEVFMRSGVGWLDRQSDANSEDG